MAANGYTHVRISRHSLRCPRCGRVVGDISPVGSRYVFLPWLRGQESRHPSLKQALAAADEAHRKAKLC